MGDHIYLHGMIFEGHHGVTDEERAELQPIELDVELELDLGPAGRSDELGQTVDYGQVFEVCQRLVGERSFRLLEGIAEALAAELLQGFERIESVEVRVKKPGTPLPGVVEHAGVVIERSRGGSS